MSQALELEVSDEYYDIIPRPTKEERSSLKNSIREHGQREPIIINQKGVILDGHTRYEICQELGIIPLTSMKFFTSDEEEKEYVVTSNLLRRNLNNFQKSELIYNLYKHEIIEGRKTKSNCFRGVGKTREILADKYGMSDKTLFNAIYVIENSDERTKKLVRQNQLSIYSAYTQIRNKESKIELKPRHHISVKKLMNFYKNDPIITEYLKNLLKQYHEAKLQ